MPRPRSVTLLALWVFSIAAFNALGAVSAIRRYTLLSQLPLSLPPAYLVAASIFWAAAFALLAVGLWRLQGGARTGLQAGYSLYLGLSWVERLVFGASDYGLVAAPFFVALHGLSLALVWGVLLRRKVRQAFTS